MKKLLYMFLALASLPLFSDVLVREMKKAPVIDGVLEAGEWPWRIEQPFTVLVKGTAPENPVELYMGYDAEFIYVALKFNVSDSARNAAPKRDLFSKPRVELRFGEGKSITLFALGFDGDRFPSGWKGVSKEGVIEVALPLEMMPETRNLVGNIVLSNGDENSSLFPIAERSFADPKFHGKYSLGTAAEIKAWKKTRAEKGRKETAKFEKVFAECRTMPSISLKPLKPWAVSPLWKPYVFEQSGKDFHFTFVPRVSDFAVPGKKNTLPLFRDAAYQVHGWDYDRGGREKLHTLEKLLADEKGVCGYILRNTNAPIYYCTEGAYTTYEKDLQISPEARKEFVEKYGKRLIALDENESVGPGGGFPMIMGLTGETPKNKVEAYEALKKAAFDKRRTFIRDWAVFYPEFQPYRSPISATFTDHIYLSFGFRMAGNECGPKTLCMPFSNAVSRGAARQYGRPFRTYLTTHEDHIEFPGWEGAHRHYTHNDYRNALFPDTRAHSYKTAKGGIYSMNGPMYGVQHLDWYRCFVYSYLCGVNTYFDECGHYLMYALYDYKTIANEDPLAVNLRDRSWHLSPMGEMMSKFYDDIVCREDRGSVYTPVAIMWDLHHGHFSNYHQKPWGLFENTEGDLMMGAVMNALFPTSDKIWYNRGFRTSSQGDVFDVITNDASQQTLDAYPSIFFCGDVPIDQGFADRLVAYVKQGGTLALNWKQVEDFAAKFPQGFFGAEVSTERRKAKASYSRFSGKLLTERLPFSYNMAKPLKGTETAVFTADTNRDPLVLVSRFGKGRVVLTMPDFLKERYSRETMLSIFGDLMLQLGREALPVSIEGDVEFMVNRNSRGWVVALFNNYGVGLNATWQNPQPKPDAKYDVKVTVKPRFKAKSVREWFTGGRELSLVVPSGDVRIIEIADK